MNTETGEIKSLSAEQDAELRRALKTAVEKDAPIPEHLPLTETDEAKIKLMSRKDRRIWARRKYQAMKQKRKRELRAAIGLPG